MEGPGSVWLGEVGRALAWLGRQLGTGGKCPRCFFLWEMNMQTQPITNGGKKQKKNRKYLLKPGARFSQKQVDEFAPEIDRLQKQLGREVQPLDIVEEAKKGNSIFAKHLELDVKKAALQHWLQQAREILRSYELVIMTVEGTEVRPRAIEFIPGEGYAHTSRVLLDEDYTVALVKRLKDELRALRIRWEQYKKIPEIAQALEAIKSLGG